MTPLITTPEPPSRVWDFMVYGLPWNSLATALCTMAVGFSFLNFLSHPTPYKQHGQVGVHGSEKALRAACQML